MNLTTDPTTDPPKDRRVREIDAVRGLALCGILFVNIVQLTGMPTGTGSGTAASLRRHAYETLLHQRFFPVFSLLFGLSLVLFLRAAADRTDHPRLVLLARLGFLIPIGLAHQVLHPGEVLLIYAVAGIVVLLPASLLPRGPTLIAGLAATALALAAGGGVWLIPGLFALGMAAARYDLHRRLDRHDRWSARVFGAGVALAIALAIALDAWQIRSVAEPSGSALAATAGVMTAAAYVFGLLALLRTGLRRPLSAILEPLGRMALTNYLMATPLVIAADQVLRFGETARFEDVMMLGTAILTVQAVFSRFWLRRHRFGPMEWVWRSLTWFTISPDDRRREMSRG